jgi:hypothetical protein
MLLYHSTHICPIRVAMNKIDSMETSELLYSHKYLDEMKKLMESFHETMILQKGHQNRYYYENKMMLSFCNICLELACRLTRMYSHRLL